MFNVLTFCYQIILKFYKINLDFNMKLEKVNLKYIPNKKIINILYYICVLKYLYIIIYLRSFGLRIIFLNYNTIFRGFFS